MRNISPYQGRESLWDFMSEVERAFDDIWRTPARGQTTARALAEQFTPAVDLHETKEFYLVSMDLPGVAEKDVKIDVQDGRLTISGERSRESKMDEGRFHRFERTCGRFQRSFALPQDVNQEKIQARYENGVLEVLIPKTEVAKAREISITTDKGGLFSRLLGTKEVKAAADTEEKH